jgi:adenosine kinase
LIYDPAFQIIILSGDDLLEGINAAWCVVGNDYEFAMMERKTGLSVDAIAERCELVVVTYGEKGSELRMNGTCVRVPAAPNRGVKDPTGAGDAYRAGLIKGLLLEQDLEIVGRIAGLTAVHAVEHVGPQEHGYTPEQFVARFDEAFPDKAGALSVEMFTR